MNTLILASILVLGASSSFGQTVNFTASKGIYDVDGFTPLSVHRGEWEVVYDGSIITPNGDLGVPFTKTGAPSLNTIFGGLFSNSRLTLV